jgi:signal transduction histidine kinase
MTLPLLKGRRLLVVDDDPMVLSTIRMMLQTSGTVCESAGGGREALQKLPHADPQMILLDYMMPEMTGVQVYQAIQNEAAYARFREVPVIMLTARTDNEEEQQQLLRMGLSAYLTKPFGYKELINVISNVFTLHDVRLQNEQLFREIREMKNYLQSIFDSITDAISVQDAAFRIQHYNAAVVSGRTDGNRRRSETGDLIRRLCYETYFSRSSICRGCPAVATLQTGTPHGAEILTEDRRVFEVHTYPVRDDQQQIRYFIETFRDVTQKKRMEEHLYESSRLASIGTLAAGVAHEINNPLCIILGFAQSLLHEDLPDGVRRELEIIEQEASRCGKILGDLLTYAKASPSDKKPCRLHEVLNHSVVLTQQLARKKRTEILFTAPADNPAVLADPVKMQQVFINLLINSVQAISQNGRIRMTLTYDRDKREAIVEVEDNGVGIAPSDLPRIFDPFFTTKAGAGTGLGLSICKSIIDEHNGTMHVESPVGGGTRVRVHLRLMDGKDEGHDR